ncbi:uncharacterized protein LOC141556885 [Sminthopsis crassicaudata]|uniref:uncharacterized protein LOC141556885 n=1 Tax=Sminthopsis crassicaudata TaxID=9301 RepID=UPI003D686BD8
MVEVAPMCQKATCLPSTGQPEASSEESSSESASEEQGTGTSQTTCDKNKTAKQDKKSKLAEGTQATANQNSISMTASNGTKSDKEDPDAVRAKQTQSLGLSPKGKASVKTESPEDSSEDEIIEPSQLQKAPPKQRPEAVASAGPAQSASSKESPQDDSSDSETDNEIGSVEKPPQTGKEPKISVSRRQMIRKGFKPGAVNCKTTLPKQGNNCQSPMQTMAPSNLPSLIQHQVSNVNENSEPNSTFFNSKASGITMLSDLPQLEKKKKSTEPLKPGKGSKSKSKRKLPEESPVAKAPKSKKKKLMGEIHKDGETLQEKTPAAPQVGKKEKASNEAKEKKPKGLHHSKKNKGKPDGNVTVTMGESREMLGTKTKKAKKHKKKSDKKKKDKDKKDKKKKKKAISKDPNASSVSLKKEKKKKKKIKQVD